MTQFQKAIEKVLKAHNQWDRFQSGLDFYLRLDQPNYDRLVIERHGEIITVGHYFEQNGDLMADPEVELHYPDWTPVAITQLLVGRREKFIEYEGQTLVDKTFHRQVSPFLAIWGRNIDAQGWTTRATVTSGRLSKESTQITISTSPASILDAGLTVSQGAKMSAYRTPTKPETVLLPPTTRRVAEGYTYAREDAPIYVKFKYMYRDASNYKQNGVAVFSNHDYLELDEIEKRIRACLHDGERFIARQVHIRERFFDTLHEDDHPWHEFNGLDTTMQALYDPEHWNQKGRIRDISEFLADLEAAHRAGWDETLVRPDVAALQEKHRAELKQGKDILVGDDNG